MENDHGKKADKSQNEPQSADENKSGTVEKDEPKDRGLPMGGSYGDVDAEGGARSGSDLPSQQQ